MATLGDPITESAFVVFVFQKPENDEWGKIIDGMQSAQFLEKHVNQSVLDLHNVAETHHDEAVSHLFSARQTFNHQAVYFAKR